MLELIKDPAEIDFKYNKRDLIPAVVQDYNTKDILMVAYVNDESLSLSIEKGETVFYSRSRQEIWHKGATSGNTQKIKEIYYDCDKDTILFMVDPAGPSCHTGENSCFFRKMAVDNSERNAVKQSDVVDFLYQLILSRKEVMPEDSYTTYLFKEGIDKILKKVGEESAEVIIASKNEAAEELILESADLLYHMLVLLAEKNIEPEQIRNELIKRHK